VRNPKSDSGDFLGFKRNEEWRRLERGVCQGFTRESSDREDIYDGLIMWYSECLRVGATSFGFLTRGKSSSGADFNCLEKE
jgi:hypothetical protein